MQYLEDEMDGNIWCAQKTRNDYIVTHFFTIKWKKWKHTNSYKTVLYFVPVYAFRCLRLACFYNHVSQQSSFAWLDIIHDFVVATNTILW